MQGLQWYASKMKVDEDGDLACDFLQADPPPPDPKLPRDQQSSQTTEASKCEVLMVDDEGNVIVGR
jgi:hypothetical protein